jgi:hypothetical protein
LSAAVSALREKDESIAHGGAKAPLPGASGKRVIERLASG